MLQKLSETRIARWLVRHRPLWDLLWGLSACVVAVMVTIWPTDRMRAIATGLALLWLVEQSLVLRAIRRKPHEVTIRNCDAARSWPWMAERLLRLEALFVDPRDLAKLTDEELKEAARMPGGDLQLGRLAKIEDRLALLEQAVASAATSVARAGITIDPLDGIDWQLKNIARVLERAAGVQELSIAIAHHRVIDDEPCVHCGCRLPQYADGSGPICPGCGQKRSGEPSPEGPDEPLAARLAQALDQLIRQCDIDESEDLAWLGEWRHVLPKEPT